MSVLRKVESENGEPVSGANSGGRTLFAVVNVGGRRYRSLWSFAGRLIHSGALNASSDHGVHYRVNKSTWTFPVLAATAAFALLASRSASSFAEQNPARSDVKEPVGGLAAIALKPFKNGLSAGRTIKLLRDEQANPSIFPEEKREEVRTNLVYSLSIHRAQINLVYESRNRSFSMFIGRCENQIEADGQWSRLKSRQEFSWVNVDDREVAYTVKGRELPGGKRTGADLVQLKQGEYLIQVFPALPNRDDPGFQLALEQAKEISKRSEPGAGGNSR